MAKSKPEIKIDPEHTAFARHLSSMEHQARVIGLYETAIAINKAVQKVGFEIEYIARKKRANDQ